MGPVHERMHVALISRDDSLKRLCRDVLATLPAQHWNLLLASPDEPAPAADLYLWDWEPQMRLPHLLGGQASSRTHLLAIGRDEARNIMEAMEALGVPRNPALAVNRDPAYHDLGICGPYRTDIAGETQYCAMFTTPTLRNVATRQVFFHNGVDHTLQQVLDFYDFRDTAPQKIYPSAADGTIAKLDDIPARYRANVDTADPPLDRAAGDAPAMTPQDERDIVAFLRTLTDGYLPKH